jgi:hypothetical protein
MSNFQGIGGVSATLRSLLFDRMELPSDVPRTAFNVTIGPPRSDAPAAGGVESSRVNLFLYRTTENGSLKNQEIPGEGHPAAYGHPPLSLDLHYLITAYGTTDDGSGVMDETRAHFLLGSAMRVLHDFPIVTDQLRTTRDPLPQPILHPSLFGQFERVKLSLEPVSLEDLSKVWTALTLPYRLAAAYQVNVVQIESQRARIFPKPVGEPPPRFPVPVPPIPGPNIIVVAFRHPWIEEIRVRSGAIERTTPYARIGDVLILRGHGFGRDGVRVIIGGLEIPVTPLADDRIEVVIPDDVVPGFAPLPLAEQLQPGVQSVEVIIGIGELPQSGFHSNLAVFMLVPRINPGGLVANLGATPRTLQINGTRLFRQTLSGETLVGRASIAKASYIAPTATQITVPLPDTQPAWPVNALISGSLAPFPALPAAPQPALQVTIDATTLIVPFPSRPTTLDEASAFLETGLRTVSGGTAAFRGARVTTLGDRLVIIPGGLHGAISIVDAPGVSTATALELVAAASTTGPVFLSGEIDPSSLLSAMQPAVKVQIDAATQDAATLAARPTSLASAASLLETAIGGGLRATTLGNQLLIVPPAGTAVMRFDPATDGGGNVIDSTTVVELQLHVRYPVRVRVNGAESIDDLTLEMP